VAQIDGVWKRLAVVRVQSVNVTGVMTGVSDLG
jgi:hypothetical protein